MPPKVDLAPDAWLDEHFDPSRASVAYLRGVFLQNDIHPPSNAKKADLVKLFHRQAAPKVAAVRARNAVAGSARGIRDLREDTGTPDDDSMELDEPVTAPRARTSQVASMKSKAGTKRARMPRSRSQSVLDSDDEQEPRKELKRPRTSASKATRRAEPVQEPEPIKEEDEMEVDEPPPRKISPKRASPARASSEDKPSRASMEGRRRSSTAHRSSEDVESGFSDFNPFQESERKKRRKSGSAPPPPEPEPEPEMEAEPPTKRSPPRSAYKPSPLSHAAQSEGASRRKSTSAIPAREEQYELDMPSAPFPSAKLKSKPRMTMPAGGMSSSASTPAFSNYMYPVEKLKAPTERYQEIVQRAQEQLAASSSSPPPRDVPAPKAKTTPQGTAVTLRKLPSKKSSIPQVLLLLLGALLLSGAEVFRRDGLAMGYCDAFNREAIPYTQRGITYELGLQDGCMRCPQMGTCSGGKLIKCDEGYMRKQSLLSLGGFLPVGDTCEPDTAMLKRRAEQEKAIESVLRAHRGEIDCGRRPMTFAVSKSQRDKIGLGWKPFGMTETEIRKQAADRLSSRAEPEFFEEDFKKALHDMRFELDRGEHEGVEYFAARSADLPLTCAVRRKTAKFVWLNRQLLSVLAAILYSLHYVRSSWRTSTAENAQVNELVDVALDKLQQQMTWNYRDPVLTPFARIASAQLRDDVLSHEHSEKQRARLWKRVEKVILKNANVRRLEAEHHGEPTTCWEWIGAPLLIEDGEGEGRRSRRNSRAPSRVSFGGEERIYPTL